MPPSPIQLNSSIDVGSYKDDCENQFELQGIGLNASGLIGYRPLLTLTGF